MKEKLPQINRNLKNIKRVLSPSLWYLHGPDLQLLLSFKVNKDCIFLVIHVITTLH